MYVVRRGFRNFGQMMTPGSLVEPGSVKQFKSRLNDGHIVEVNEQDFDKWQKYFKDRIGVEISMPEKPEKPAEPEKPVKPVEPEKQAEPVKVAKVVKPAATAVVKAH